MSLFPPHSSSLNRGVQYINNPYRLPIYRHFLKISISTRSLRAPPGPNFLLEALRALRPVRRAHLLVSFFQIDFSDWFFRFFVFGFGSQLLRYCHVTKSSRKGGISYSSRLISISIRPFLKNIAININIDLGRWSRKRPFRTKLDIGSQIFSLFSSFLEVQVFKCRQIKVSLSLFYDA